MFFNDLIDLWLPGGQPKKIKGSASLICLIPLTLPPESVYLVLPLPQAIYEDLFLLFDLYALEIASFLFVH